nr:DUF397 domain-containing protein [Micromonospora sp. DSM 115978]
MSQMEAFDRNRAVWRKSTRSNGNSGDCVEFAGNLPGIVGVRDSKDQHGPVLVFTPDTWTAFASGVRRGAFDLG